MFRSILVISCLCLITQAARADRIDKRQSNQQKRISQGIASGELNPTEAKHLEAREEHVQKLENHAKTDGKVTKKEKIRLEVAQDRTSHAIARKKHNLR